MASQLHELEEERRQLLLDEQSLVKVASDDQNLSALIEEAKQVLQPLFAKPKLKSHLLQKPPFRYIHDIILATVKATRFPAFFTNDELDSSKYKDNKQAKIAFLEKLIRLVNVCPSSSPVEVNAKKIVAGLEPAATLRLLLAFGKLANEESIHLDNLIRRCKTRVEIVEKEMLVDEYSEDDDMKEEPEIERVRPPQKSFCIQSMAYSIDNIIKFASKIENLSTERESPSPRTSNEMFSR